MTFDPPIRVWKGLLVVGVVLLAGTAVLRTALETKRLLLGEGHTSATDLRLFHEQCVTWFSGEDAYAKLTSAVYPPGTYPLMAPLYIWDWQINRKVWLVHSLVVLAVLMWLCVRESGATSSLEKACVALLPVAMYSTGIAMGNGQLTIHALTAVIGSILLLYRDHGRWWDDLMTATLLLFALIKPSLTAPFFWIVLIVPRRARPALFVIGGYIVLTFIGASFQPAGIVAQFNGFLGRGASLAARAGYGHVPLWLSKTGYENLMLPFTVLALAAMGAWVWVHRSVDRWLLLGVLALMTRFWSYHRVYDDMLNLLPMIALLRLAHGRAGNNAGGDRMAWIVLIIALLTVPGPATPLREFQSWFGVFLRIAHTAVRLFMLGFLMQRAWVQRGNVQECEYDHAISH